MKIQLTQTNIVEGIRMYLESRGIKLQGRDLQVLFTAGRKQSGLIADVDIEDNSEIGKPITDVPYRGDSVNNTFDMAYQVNAKPAMLDEAYAAQAEPTKFEPVPDLPEEGEVATVTADTKTSLFG